ncbi:MAG: hypothetical protein IJT79_05575 [Ruminococcus sp.]|nr:hypothetical protein [Ruminococcus sp.]
MEFSLFFPENVSENNTLNSECINDLSIEFLLDALTENKNERIVLSNLMSEICPDPEVIRYRGGVFEDFYYHKELRTAMEELIPRLADLRDIERFQKDQEGSALWSLVNRLREIDEYVNCITSLKSTLEKIDIQSDGMKRLREYVTKIDRDSGFDELRADMDETFEKVRKLRSITIGVNLDELLRPKTAGIVSLNDTEFRDSGLMRRFMKFVDKKELNEGVNLGEKSQFHPANPSTSRLEFGAVVGTGFTNDLRAETTAATGSDSISNAIRKPVTDIMKKTVSDIKSTLKRYVNISGYALINLMPEILFYVRWAELIEKINASGMPVCKAEIKDCKERYCSVKELYNIKLAIKKVNGEDINIITNDIDFNDEHRIFILTGPNRGGKTIFTQAVGFTFLLAQWGVYVPASKAVLSPVDNIFTHFPADENETVDLGRLGEESKRLSEIFDTATDKSLLLLNESLATTSVAEGLFIAKDVVMAMRYLGVRAVFNTHMHDLARSLDEFNAAEGKSSVESIITGVHDGERSFKVSIDPPQGVSYAKDIAVKYGVTYDIIKGKIDKKSG